MNNNEKQPLEFEVSAHTNLSKEGTSIVFYATQKNPTVGEQFDDSGEYEDLAVLAKDIAQAYRRHVGTSFMTECLADRKPLYVTNMADPAHITNEVNNDPYLARPLDTRELEQLLRELEHA